MLNLVACDDVNADLEALVSLVNSTSYALQLRVRTANSPVEILQLLNDGMSLDILLTDIKIDSCNGIDFVKEIQAQHPLMQIIYVTGYDKYHTKAYETDHVCFLKKPVKIEAMEQALSLAFERRKKICGNVISITDRGRTECIKLAGIRYLEGVARKTVIYTDDGPKEFSRKLSELEKQLDDSFVKCHKSFIVNMRRVKLMTYGSFELEGGETVPISQRMQKNTKDYFLKYIGNDR